MSATRKRLRQEIADLKKQEAAILDALATSIANRDRLDADLTDDRKDRDRLKKAKQQGREYDQAKLKELNQQVRENRAKLATVRSRLKNRRTRRQKIRQAIRRRRTRLRNLARPRIIDLDLTFRPMATQGTVNKVIGHYTAGPQDRSTEDAIRLCRIYHQAHLNQGWSGEGYHLCFTVDGDILLLRPTRYVGAHTLGANTGSYGVMCHGTTGDRPTAAQKRAMRWWAKHGHKPLMGKGRAQKQPADYPWYGHNDFNATSCPGSFKPTYLARGNK